MGGVIREEVADNRGPVNSGGCAFSSTRAIHRLPRPALFHSSRRMLKFEIPYSRESSKKGGWRGKFGPPIKGGRHGRDLLSRYRIDQDKLGEREKRCLYLVARLDGNETGKRTRERGNENR